MGTIKHMRAKRTAPEDIEPLATTEVMRLAALAKVKPSDRPPMTASERKQQDRQKVLEARRTKPYYQRIAIVRGSAPADEEFKVAEPYAPPDECPSCKGAGILATPDGKLVPCECKRAEIEAKKISKAQRLADLTPEMAGMTFESFIAAYDPDAYAAALAFTYGVDAQGQPMPPWLYFEGKPGTGKTHLMAAIAHTCIARGEIVMFRVVPRLLNWFKQGFKDDNEDYQWRFDEVCNVPVLLLDDIGSERRTDWSREQLFTLINHRYARNLRTVFSTNVSLEHLEDRIRSRIGDQAKCEIVFTTDTDYRARDERISERKKGRNTK